MQRFIGGVLILTATAGAGYVYGMELKTYLETMRYLRYVISLIKGEISYSGTPLQEVFAEVAERVREPYRADRYLKPLRLKYEHMILLKEPGTFLASLERDTLDRTLQIYLNRMDLEIEKLREGLAGKIRVGGCLGVMSGIFLIVILL